MSHIIGRGRYARSTYPQSPSIGLGVSGPSGPVFQLAGATGPTGATGPGISLFTGPTGGTSLGQISSLPAYTTPSSGAGTPNPVAAIVVTPKKTGLFLVLANIIVQNGATADTFLAAVLTGVGTGLTVTGGSTFAGGWTLGTSVPVVVTPTPTLQFPGGAAELTIPANGIGTLSMSGVNPVPLALGVPAVIEVDLLSVTGVAVAGISVQATAFELS
jgi:hypothetical protein